MDGNRQSLLYQYTLLKALLLAELWSYEEVAKWII